MHAFIFNIQRFSIHDGPGIRTTVFFQGCPLQCSWCHNPEGIPQYIEKPGNEEEQLQIKKYTSEMLLEEILKDRVFYEESGGGVTFSGGEPLMQSEFLLHMLKMVKNMNIHSAIDTSGYAPTDIFIEACELADLILFDLKLMDNNKHRLYTGTDNVLIHQNLDYLLHQATPFRIRIPLINELTATRENLEQIAYLLGRRKDIHIDLLSYHDLGKGKRNKIGLKDNKKTRLTAPSAERLHEISDYFESHGYLVSLGG